MLEPGLRRLLDEAINTSTKLAIVLLYANQRLVSATPAQISQRLCRDIWSVEEALDELAEDGILQCHSGLYTYRPASRWAESLRRLFATYDEPLRRQEIMRVVSDLDSYAPYRSMINNRIVSVF